MKHLLPSPWIDDGTQIDNRAEHRQNARSTI
jgi:hypothetical protein